MTAVEKQFNAAVKVIQGLPKDGPFQPSHTLALKFYGLYKQGTEGPCDIPKPAFWQMIAKAKYDAWKTVGKMTKEEAKRTYIEELKKIIEQNSGSFSVEQIIETMSFNSDVASFTELLGAFYEFVPEEMRERMVSAIAEQDEDASVSDSGVDVRSPTERELANALGQYMDSSSLSDEDEDAIKDEELREEADRLKSELADLQRDMMLLRRPEVGNKKDMAPSTAAKSKVEYAGESEEEEVFEDPVGQEEAVMAAESPPSAIRAAVAALNKDVQQIRGKVSDLEERQNNLEKSLRQPIELSQKTVIFFLAWPFIAHGIISVARSAIRSK